ncbi:MAG: hypothetical protein UY52_C0001G0097 [Parcubacteria group bacterium GW2011_GWC2_49_9]|nr:MAG: hypothetical protein UY52_C0001G0097 [Parcubacteria group bacterium GW2011_GWC2_49_9]
MTPADQNPPRYITRILIILLVSRILLCLVGVGAREIFKADGVLEIETTTYSTIQSLDIWGRWDSVFYIFIAEHGYTDLLTSQVIEPLDLRLLNFFPLYPLLTYLLSYILGNTFISALIISNVALGGATLLLFRIVQKESDDKTAFHSVMFFILFPTSFLFSAALTESLFLFLVFLTVYAIQRSRWFLALIMTIFASVTRSIGIFLLIPLIFYYVSEVQRGFLNFFSRLWEIVIPAGIGLFIWGAYNYSLTGDFLYFTHTQKYWFKELGNPFTNISSLLSGKDDEKLLLAGWRRIRLPYLVWAVAVMFLPISMGIGNTMRYIAPVFPIYILLGKSIRNPYVLIGTYVALGLSQILLFMNWAIGGPLVV